ncbi:hypothetical protein [Sphingomonas sp.]|jgi:hypothetical protein|uniref:hypothetical protein n=1 Tax=Sphingomonas sp. TaxID=28214 RepID=UPI003D6CBC35
MTGVVQVQYQNATFTANTATIVIENGTISLDNHGSFGLSGSFQFNNLNVSSGSVSFYNQSPDTPVNGTANISVSSSGKGDPKLTANNFSGSVELQWPTNDGTKYQQLSSGESITLSDFNG